MAPLDGRAALAAAQCLSVVLALALLAIGLRAGDAPIGVSAALLSALLIAMTVREQRSRSRAIADLQNWLDARRSVAGAASLTEALADDLTRNVEALLDSPPHGHARWRDRDPTAALLAQARSLSVLYDVAAGVNISRDLDDLLAHFLDAVSKVADTRAVAVRLLDGEQLRLAAQVGLDPEHLAALHAVPLAGTSSGRAISEQRVIWQDDRSAVHLGAAQRLMDENPQLLMVCVPMQYRDSPVGVYNIFVDRRHIAERGSLELLFQCIGRHLGIAIEKTRLEREAHQLHIMHERSRFSAELHDSMAQTLASLRFQLRVLDEGLDSEPAARNHQRLAQAERAVAEANTELRELIAHFRAPIDKRGLIPAIRTAVDRFGEDTGINVFFHSSWSESPLDGEQEMQVLRIVQESLANVRKHAGASTVRVLLSEADERAIVLIEDDGVGFDPLAQPGAATAGGHHIGLGIMRTRAEQLAAELEIDSEPGEGTRVSFKFLPRDAGIAENRPRLWLE